MVKLVTTLKNNVRYVVLFILSLTLLIIAQHYKTNNKEPSKELGIELVNALYTYDSLDDLYSTQSKKLLKIMPENLVHYYRDDNILRGIWYSEKNGLISGISEAWLYPFATNEEEGDSNEK